MTLVAYEAAQRHIDAQKEELSGMRTRAVAFSAFVLTGTSFLVGTSLQRADSTPDLIAWAILATSAFVLMLLALLAMVLPLVRFKFVLDPAVLWTWIDGETPAPSKEILLRHLAGKVMPSMIQFNGRALTAIRVLFGVVLGAGAIGLLGWLVITFAFASWPVS